MPIQGRLPRIVNVLLGENVRYALSWVLLLLVGGITFCYAWTSFNMAREIHPSARRRGGNAGHTLIDFGGQWLIGAMVAHGEGQHLYHRSHQWRVLREGYPEEEEVPREEWISEEPYQHEYERLMGWFVAVGSPQTGELAGACLVPLSSTDALSVVVLAKVVDSRRPELEEKASKPDIGGPLYPPVHALIMYPMGLMSPARAYRLNQILGLVFALISGWGICRIANGKIWWPIASVGIVLFPGFISCLILGQNSIFMVTLVISGWALMTAGRPFAGGLVWGVLAFKPVWLVALFIVPLLTRRWRSCLGMIACAAGLALATLPMVGWHSWLEWFRVGREASRIYGVDQNWVFLSRDLLNIPRRWLFDLPNAPAPANELVANIVGWSLLAAVFECTVRLTLIRNHPASAPAGPAAAFLLLGAWFCCYHFMYYDVLLTALPIFLLLTEPSRYLRPRLLLLKDSPNRESLLSVPDYSEPRWASLYPYLPCSDGKMPALVFVVNSMTLTLILLFVLADSVAPGLGISASVSAGALTGSLIPLPLKFSTAAAGTPWSVFCLIALWLWCGWRSVRQDA
jgi:hypothetical protein